VLATHGRSFWVMDDVASLRQMTAARAAGGDYLFAPAAAYRIREGNQEGTPLPLDEPQVDNPAAGLYIDYFLPRDASTPVAIEILNAGGRVVRHWSSAQPAKAVDPKSVDFTAHWIEQHPVPETSPGAHRFVWDFHQTDSKGPLLPPGSYTVRLSVDGKTYDRAARVLRDPRIAATDTDLVAQYELAERLIALRAEVAVSRAKARTLGSSSHLSAAGEQALRRDVIGLEPSDNPDDSMGAYSHDFTSFLFLENQLDYLENAVESADAAPTPDMRLGYAKLDLIYRQTLARLHAIAPIGR
jgi:hypothetical protein